MRRHRWCGRGFRLGCGGSCLRLSSSEIGGGKATLHKSSRRKAAWSGASSEWLSETRDFAVFLCPDARIDPEKSAAFAPAIHQWVGKALWISRVLPCWLCGASPESRLAIPAAIVLQSRRSQSSSARPMASGWSSCRKWSACPAKAVSRFRMCAVYQPTACGGTRTPGSA